MSENNWQDHRCICGPGGIDGYTLRRKGCMAHPSSPPKPPVEPPAPSDADIERACAWADYRKDYGVGRAEMTAAHQAFLAGWDAAHGSLDIGGVLR